ncbi:MAG: rubrerythrin family protein [Chloroflexi bacterium]|jgi:rubrerythrin|nr:rubrerythrin family protein [Chloroflexota bacterium]
MHDITSANLHNAYGGESMAHMRYRTWGDKAEQDGFPNVARLFRAITFAEQIHANNHFRELKDLVGGFGCNSGAIFGLGSTSQNLQGGIDGETFEINEMYPTYLETAKFQGEKGAQQSFYYALSAEKTHAALFQKAKTAVDSGKDVQLGPMLVCTVCGWTHEGNAPDKCPICGAKKEKFRTFA